MKSRAGRLVLLLCAGAFAVLGAPSPALAQPQPQDPIRLRLTIGELSPRVITSGSSSLTVTGKITNIGDRRIDDLQVRVQRGQPETSEQQMREALGHNQPTEAGQSAFTPVAPALQPGQSANLTITVPITGQDGTGLGIDQPGVYPLLVNINGKPEFGGTARLATSGLLLPVLGVPGKNTKAPSRPSKVSLLWPLIDDYPRVVRTEGDKVVLSDDALATSLAAGGRLYELLGQLDSATSTDPDLQSSVCVAIDPDLVETARAMAGGYLVAGKDGRTHQGTGATAADIWVDRLRSLVTGNQCVLALPYADVDLAALSRAGAVDIEQLALSGSAVVQGILGVTPQPGLYWPDRGTLDQRTLADLAANGPVTVLADPAKVQRSSGPAPWTVGATGSSTTAVPVDGLLGSALTNRTSVQDALAVLAYRTLFDGTGGDHLLIAPPRHWAMPANELEVWLDQLGSWFAGSFAEPESLADLVHGPAGGTAAGLEYSPADQAAEIPRSVTKELVRVDNTQRDLVNAMHEDPASKVVPGSLIQPLKFGLVRATSTGWRGHVAMAKARVAGVRTQLSGMIGKVSVQAPGPPISLGSQNAPLPVIVTNRLPVAMAVQIKLSDVPGLQAAPVPVRMVPAGSNVTVFAESKVLRSGRFTVDVSLSTPSGDTVLGSTARLELNSTSYGTITIVVTGIAGGALVLLSGRRIYRRIRTARAGAATAPEPQGEARR
ncbi:DUF6049 family protein [Labedaea rhizosphaerae]|uniref:DUF6049 family protein n=1 Tax=Labedaea rhizosphaerae TaxID=598644 RepID=UPI00105F31C2|nr:DUF6049 family protein [Labedaea rhizosphaerae]